jgi:hypothetical protein
MHQAFRSRLTSLVEGCIVRIPISAEVFDHHQIVSFAVNLHSQETAPIDRHSQPKKSPVRLLIQPDDMRRHFTRAAAEKAHGLPRLVLFRNEISSLFENTPERLILANFSDSGTGSSRAPPAGTDQIAQQPPEVLLRKQMVCHRRACALHTLRRT